MNDARQSGKPVVSVVIPTRDRGHRLSLALRSALGQRAVDVEVIVVDDGSRDETAVIVGRVGDARVRLFRNESPRGESGARNRGVAEAQGTWIAFLDDDDLWAPDKLSHQLRALNDARRDWAYAGDVAVDEQLQVLYGSPPCSPDKVMASLERHNSVPAGSSNVIVRSAVLAQVGPFDAELKRTADWDMWLRLARVGPPACVRRPLVAICVHSGNMSRDMETMFRELDIVARRYAIPVDRARHHRWAAWGALIDGRRWNAARHYAGAVAAGDLLSVVRAPLALVWPRRTRVTGKPDSWTDEARKWLDDLARQESALHSANRHD